MPRKTTTQPAPEPGDWTKNLADFDYDEDAYEAALAAHLAAHGEQGGE
jgi:hypothetical protein